MKMRSEHYEVLRSALSIFSAADIATRRKDIVNAGKSKDVEMRLRWDLLWASTVASKWICDNLYPYINDDHIDTALRSIVREIK